SPELPRRHIAKVARQRNLPDALSPDGARLDRQLEALAPAPPSSASGATTASARVVASRIRKHRADGGDPGTHVDQRPDGSAGGGCARLHEGPVVDRRG